LSKKDIWYNDYGENMAIIDVLKCDKPELMVWKWQPPSGGKREEELRLGTQLIVNHSQQAIFVKDGQIADVFDAGRHTLSAQNLPILTNLIGLAFGGQSPFKAEVYFINKVVVMDTKFGLLPFNMIEPNFRVPVPITSRGSFALKVVDSGIFLNRIIGTLKDFESDTLKQYFRGIITENIKSAIYKIAKEQNLSPLELEAIVLEVSDAVKGIISETLTKFGLCLELFNIEAISIIDEDARVQKIVEDYQRLMSQDMEERLRLKRRAENLEVYKTERTFDTTEKVAENIGGGVGGDSGGIVGTLIGLGMAQPIANTMAHTVSNVTQNIQQPSASPAGKDDVIQLLQKLGELKTAGILSEEEFTEKKKELLSKL
jgi:membrane protease subunit (stomatin/prohibitin family)